MPTAAISDRPAALLRAFGIALLVPALAILLHEMGHWTSNAILGYDLNRLTYANAISGNAPAGMDSAVADGLSFGAGATVSLLLVILATLSVRLKGPTAPAIAVIVFEMIRGAVGLVQRIATAGTRQTLTTGLGEIRYIVHTFDGPHGLELALSFIELLAPVLAFTYVVRRLNWLERRRTVPAVFAGLLVGLVLWLGVIGPRMLPM